MRSTSAHASAGAAGSSAPANASASAPSACASIHALKCAGPAASGPSSRRSSLTQSKVSAGTDPKRMASLSETRRAESGCPPMLPEYASPWR